MRWSWRTEELLIPVYAATSARADVAARNGDRSAMTALVLHASRHVVTIDLTTFGGFLPSTVAGGSFLPPFATAIAGSARPPTVLGVHLTAPAFADVATSPATRLTGRQGPFAR